MEKIIFLFMTLIAVNSWAQKATSDPKSLEALIEQLNKNASSGRNGTDCSDYPEYKPQAFLTDENNRKRDFPGCISRNEGYDYCRYFESQRPLSFKLTNRGGGTLIPQPKPNQSRTWDFQFPNQARQDIQLQITDAPNGQNSQLRESYIYFFPRKHTPAIRAEGNKLRVTLPTGEEVQFDAKTKDVLPGGVLAENGPIAKVGPELSPAKVSYNGSGVMVRVDARGKDPRLGAGTAQITKKGKTCEVPKSELWRDQTQDSALRFRFARDEDFDAFLQQKCGFGI